MPVAASAAMVMITGEGMPSGVAATPGMQRASP
jgi:hypothetical protein